MVGNGELVGAKHGPKGCLHQVGQATNVGLHQTIGFISLKEPDSLSNETQASMNIYNTLSFSGFFDHLLSCV